MAGPLGLALGGLVCLAGCSGTRQAQQAGPAAPLPFWPAPPEEPRIAYVQSVTRPADLGVKLSTLGRFRNWITGSEKGNEPLVKPFGVALDEKDNLCLTDMGANTVCFWNRANKKWRRWQKVGPLRFLSPVAVAKRNDILFVADSALSSVVAFDGEGTLRFQITNKLERPSGLAILGERLFVTDSRRHCVASFDLAGRHLFEFGRRGTGPGEFNFPTHIAADRADHLYVTDSMNGRVQRFNAAGVFEMQVSQFGDGPGSFSRPKGVTVDSFGHIYVVDALFDNIQVFDQQARFLLNWGEGGASPGQFWLPNGIAASRANEIFVADSYNRRIQVFKYIGQP